jgi:hypothetical protein
MFYMGRIAKHGRNSAKLYSFVARSVLVLRCTHFMPEHVLPSNPRDSAVNFQIDSSVNDNRISLLHEDHISHVLQRIKAVNGSAINMERNTLLPLLKYRLKR